MSFIEKILFEAYGLPAQIFEKIKAKYGIIKVLGGGGHGTAFLTSDDKVVKITKSAREVKFFLDKKDKNLTHFVKIYDIKKLTISSLHEYYLIVKDYVPNLISSDEDNIMTEYLYASKSDQRKLVKNLNNEGRTDDINFLKQLIEFQKELHVDLNNDLNSHNIGWKNGILVGFDLQATSSRINHKKLDQFTESMMLKEIGDMNFSFPFKKEQTQFKNGVLTFASYIFQTNEHKYRVELKTSFDLYGLAFYPTDGEFDTLTNEKIVLKIISTVANILKYIVNEFELFPIPIYVKGYPKIDDGEELSKETSRDRVYKFIAKKNLNFLPGYTFEDGGDSGFTLVPKKQNTLIEKISHELFLLEKKSNYKFGCVMLNVSFPEINEIQSRIKKEDLYEEKDNDKFGLEKENHITLLYGLHKEVESKEVKSIIDSFTFPANIVLNKISLFDIDERYDVLKFDVGKSFVSKVNKKLCELPFTNEYPDYQPHMTIAYLKKGMGKVYVAKMKGIKNIDCKVEDVLFKTSSGEKSTIKIKENKQIIKEFLDVNVMPPSLYKKIQNSYGIKHKLGTGTAGGSAFLTNDGRVVKLTNDYREVNFYVNIKKHNYKHFVKVYDIKKITYSIKNDFDETENETGFIILKDYADKLLSHDETFWINRFLAHASLNYKSFVKHYKLDSTIANLLKQLIALKKELHVGDSNDLISSNMGWKNNILVAFDLESKSSKYPSKVSSF